MSQTLTTTYIPTATVAGKLIPVESFNVINGAYGSTGKATFITSITALGSLGIDLIGLSASQVSGVEVCIYMQEGTQAPVKIFGGEFILSSWDYDEGEVEIHARDWAGVLVDQKKVLVDVAAQAIQTVAPLEPSSDGQFSISTQNQTITQLVTNIATSYGLTPVLNLGSGNNPTIGSIYGTDDSIYTPVPQSLWGILVQLAQDTGYEIYVTPSKQLVFGEAGAGLSTFTINYNTQNVPNQALPSNKLNFTHNTRRNATFRVLVISYDPTKAQTVLGRATAISTNYAGLSGLAAGVVTGNAAITTDGALTSAEGKLGKIPLYSFHIDGLTSTQAQIKASAIAYDIAKREYMVSVEVDGFSAIQPTQKFSFVGGVDGHFLGQTFYVTTYSHNFRMPGRGTTTSGGFYTTVKGLNVPIDASDGT